MQLFEIIEENKLQGNIIWVDSLSDDMDGVFLNTDEYVKWIKGVDNFGVEGFYEGLKIVELDGVTLYIEENKMVFNKPIKISHSFGGNKFEIETSVLEGVFDLDFSYCSNKESEHKYANIVDLRFKIK